MKPVAHLAHMCIPHPPNCTQLLHLLPAPAPRGNIKNAKIKMIERLKCIKVKQWTTETSSQDGKKLIIERQDIIPGKQVVVFGIEVWPHVLSVL